jgi:Zn-dependent peptidase ImmA (M78 family)
MFSDMTREEYHEALEQTAEQLLWEADIEPGGVDAFELAERLGVTVLRDDHLPRRGQFVRLAAGHGGGSQAAVLLGREPRSERQQWALAHELGESIAWQVFDRLGVARGDIRPGSREQVASALASRILLPLRAFRKSGVACDWDLLELKATFPTASHELIARRLLDLRNPIVVTVVDQKSITWRRSNIAGVPNQMTAGEDACWRQCHAAAEPVVVDSTDEQVSGATVRCWPIHEPHWSREILTMSLAAA